ncbi:MAG TPA: hypothetical protein VK447_10395, partial [Myxococcaceae bacterium]|nr:hypothetical protein [Myxococcaceae bacterium]
MDSPNRINPLALTHTVERQTPKNEFGQVLSQTVGTGMRATMGILSAAVRGDVGAVAVKGLEALGAGSPPSAQAAGPVTSGTTSVGTTSVGSTSGGGEVAGAGGGW